MNKVVIWSRVEGFLCYIIYDEVFVFVSGFDIGLGVVFGY